MGVHGLEQNERLPWAAGRQLTMIMIMIMISMLSWPLAGAFLGKFQPCPLQGGKLQTHRPGRTPSLAQHHEI
jgi:hypothetical protein